jgi:hypothetical protein
MPCGNKASGVRLPAKGLSGTPSYAQSWNYNKFATNSYNLTNCGESWCVKPGSIYTNPNANFEYFGNNGKQTCGDPYTYYSYWYRRFPSQTSYLNCYFLPFAEPAYFKNSYGYEQPNGNCQYSTNLRSNGNDGFAYFDSQINPRYAVKK